MVFGSYVFIIAVAFVVYYITVLIVEKRIMNEPKHIITRFLSVVFLYAGISLIYFSITGEVFVGDSMDNYNLYIFIMGFIAVFWALPDLLQEFTFFRKLIKDHKFIVEKRKDKD
ncbi:MAG: hypothetical protein WC867_01915 [Candidatus Pacearchaeota archaeon]|jgi:hypothetical protein